MADRLPLPEHVIALGEAELAAGRVAAGRRDLALVGAEQQLLSAAGVDTDVELAIFEADHGDPRRAVALARRGWAQAPSVRAADALGWALTRAGEPREGLRWARRALRLGSLDPLWRAHAGLSAVAAGGREEGRRQLRIALAHGLDGCPWQARRARRALASDPDAAAAARHWRAHDRRKPADRPEHRARARPPRLRRAPLRARALLAAERPLTAEEIAGGRRPRGRLPQSRDARGDRDRPPRPPRPRPGRYELSGRSGGWATCDGCGRSTPLAADALERIRVVVREAAGFDAPLQPLPDRRALPRLRSRAAPLTFPV